MKVTKNLNKVVHGANSLSVGISVVVAILIGIGLGVYFKNLTGSVFALIFWILIGIAAAFLNLYRAYKSLNADLTELENDPRYKNYKTQNFDDDDEWGENSQENSPNSKEKPQNSDKTSANLQNQSLFDSVAKSIKNLEN